MQLSMPMVQLLVAGLAATLVPTQAAFVPCILDSCSVCQWSARLHVHVQADAPHSKRELMSMPSQGSAIYLVKKE
jgi:hypothetical protein